MLRFINWETIMTLSMWALLVGIVTFGYQDHQSLMQMEDTLFTHLESTETLIGAAKLERAANEDKLAQLLKYHEADYQLTGTGSVGTFGGDESFVRVNRSSDAKVYKDGDRIRIKCDVEGKPEAVLIVDGTFSDTNRDILISFSKEAAAGLGIVGRVGVELEPEGK